ncbi:hypothetical protein JCM10296v2_003203 [Rhodotorula toruloides]
MQTTLPLELTLLVVNIAHFRRLDENGVEHLQRLTRLALVCKAFHRVVKRTLEGTVRISLGPQTTGVVQERLREMESRGYLLETLVVHELPGRAKDALPEALTSLKKVVFAGPDVVELSTSDFTTERYPVLCSLSLSVKLARSPLSRVATPLVLTELLLASCDEEIIRHFIHPSITPSLRHLCLFKFHSISPQPFSLLSDVKLFQRLEALELSDLQDFPTYGTEPVAAEVSTPTLWRASCLASDLLNGVEFDDCRVSFVQLQCLDAPGPSHGVSLLAIELWVKTIGYITQLVEHGLRPVAVFLPDNIQSIASTPPPLRIRQACDQVLEAFKAHGEPYISWYRANEETDVSPSEPFRRYLDRERLEGRM